MFNTFQAACSAITNNCSTTTTYTTRVTNFPEIGNALYTDAQATVLAGSGFIVNNNSVYTIVNGIITAITICTSPAPSPVAPTPAPIGPPVSNLIERKYVYTGYPNLYTSNNDVYDKILNKFSSVANEITSVYTTNGFNMGSNVYKTSVGTLFGTGYLAYFVGDTLKKVKVTNGVITETESDISVSPVINPSTTKILSPFNHYNTSGNFIGTGYAIYENNGNFLYFLSKLEIAPDGLTITDTQWGNPAPGTKYWLLNKEIVSNGPLTSYKIPEIYKGTVVEIQIVKKDSSNPEANNSFSYTLLIAK
jgi:hypothetical protein